MCCAMVNIEAKTRPKLATYNRYRTLRDTRKLEGQTPMHREYCDGASSFYTKFWLARFGVRDTSPGGSVYLLAAGLSM